MVPGTLTEAANLLRSGQLSAKDLCSRCLKRVRALRSLNIFVTETPDIAKSQAEAADRRLKNGSSLGILDGIPIAVKDNFSTKDIMTSCASRILHGYVPPYNATVVQRFLNNGAVLMGKTNLDEFAMGSATVDSCYGPVKNPWKLNIDTTSWTDYTKQSRHVDPGIDTPIQNRSNNDMNVRHLPNMCDNVNHKKGHYSEQNKPPSLDISRSRLYGDTKYTETDFYVPGGSSGGSAVSVATGVSLAALGSDTGGSVRIPASFTGVIGLKPTYGLLSRHGLISLVNSLDVPGIFTRSIDDAVAVLNALAGHDPLDSTTVTDNYEAFDLPENLTIKKFHVGIPKQFHSPGLSAEVLESWNLVADMFENAGCKVSEVSLPHTQYALACYSVLNCCEVASNMARYDGIEFGHRAGVEESTEALFAATRHEGFNEVVRGRILSGNYFLLEGNYDKYFVQAQKVRQLIMNEFLQVFNSGVDVLLAPTTQTTAPTYTEFINDKTRVQQLGLDIYCMSSNLAGIPAVSLPVRLSNDGLPIGLQLIGRSFQEKRMLTIAKWLEQQVNFPYLNFDHQ